MVILRCFPVLFVLLPYACQVRVMNEPFQEFTNSEAGVERERIQEQQIDANGQEPRSESMDNLTLCQKTLDDWKLFAKKAQVCKEGESCIVVGFRGTCGCSYGIAGVSSHGGGLSINFRYKKEASEIEERYFRYCERAKDCGQDSIKSSSGGCVGLKCTTKPNSLGGCP